MRFYAPVLFVSLACCGTSALAGPDWLEGGYVGGPDAGSTADTAQQVVGVNQLRKIYGSLSSSAAFEGPVTPDLEDMYLIRINVPGTFSFEVTGALFDAQLFLFNITLPGEAFGLLANNDTSTSNQPRLTRPATDGTGADVLLPGVYALAISGLGRVPISMSGQIFSFGVSTEISGPDGPGGLNPHTGWTGNGQTGDYLIEMRDVGWFDVPAPGSATVLLGGLVMIGRRRRRV